MDFGLGILPSTKSLTFNLYFLIQKYDEISNVNLGHDKEDASASEFPEHDVLLSGRLGERPNLHHVLYMDLKLFWEFYKNLKIQNTTLLH